MGAEDFTFYLLEKPGCYFVIGNGDGTHRDGSHGGGPVHAPQPELRLQRRADSARCINVGAARGSWLVRATRLRAMSRPPSSWPFVARQERRRCTDAAVVCPHLRRSAREVPRGRGAAAAGVASRAAPRPRRRVLAIDVARVGADDARRAADHLQRLPRHRGLLRLGRAGRAAATTTPSAQAAPDAGVALLFVHALNPWGFSSGAASRTRAST